MNQSALGQISQLVSMISILLWSVVSDCAIRSPQSNPATVSRTILGISETRFTVNQKPTFLLGISYYAGLGARNEVVQSDITQIRKSGFNWLRVWAVCDFFNNDISAVDGMGNPRSPYLDRLHRLVADCDRQGLVVDVTLTRGSGADPQLSSLADLTRATETVVSRLKPFGNWYLDLANERNIGDKRFVSVKEVESLRATVRNMDPKRLVTASQGGDIGKDELRDYLMVARVDFVCPHRPRGASSASETGRTTRDLLGWMREIGRVVPVHYQEPFRRGYEDWQPRAEDFEADLQAARAGGAAGWCFHNGGTRSVKDGRPRRSFDLRDGSLFAQLDEEERRFVARLRHIKNR